VAIQHACAARRSPAGRSRGVRPVPSGCQGFAAAALFGTLQAAGKQCGVEPGGKGLAKRLGPRNRACPLATRSRNGTSPTSQRCIVRCRPRGRDRRPGPGRPCRP
jgi:hypothetical protein